jgi:hypothetical protein
MGSNVFKFERIWYLFGALEVETKKKKTVAGPLRPMKPTCRINPT